MTDAETGGVALIRFVAPGGTPCVGSGLLISSRSVLTADHIAGGSGHRADFHGHSYEVTRILRSGSPEVDLAILTMNRPIASVVSPCYARVNRKLITEVPYCRAVGFPRWKRDGDKRRSAQVNGVIPTGEGLAQTADTGLREGFLTLVGNRHPSAPLIHQGPLTESDTPSPWGGMSGAVVTAGGRIIGVVRSINLAGDGQSLTVTPVTGLDQLPDQALAQRFWDALGVADPASLPLIPTGQEPDSNTARARSGRNTLAAASAAFAGGTLLSEFLTHHPHAGHDKTDIAAREPNHLAASSEGSHVPHENTGSTHHRQHDGTHHEDAHFTDSWPDDSGFQQHA